MAQKAARKIEKTVKSYIEQLESIGIHVQQAILLLKLQFRKRSGIGELNNPVQRRV